MSPIVFARELLSLLVCPRPWLLLFLPFALSLDGCWVSEEQFMCVSVSVFGCLCPFFLVLALIVSVLRVDDRSQVV